MKIKKIYYLLFVFFISISAGLRAENTANYNPQSNLEKKNETLLLSENTKEPETEKTFVKKDKTEKENLKKENHKKHNKKSNFDMAAQLQHHLIDKMLIPIPVKIAGKSIDFGITRRVLVMWFVAFLMIVLFTIGARRISKNPMRIAGKASGMLEVLVQFVRKDVAEAGLDKHSKPYEHYLLSLFFFVLFSNLIGLVPSPGSIIEFFKALFAGGGAEVVHHVAVHGAHHESFWQKYFSIITPTGDVNVTLGLAIITFVMIWFVGFRYQGILYIRNIVPKGVPLLLWLIMWPVEFLGPFMKSFALTIRLLANMTGGHVVIIALLGLIFQFQNGFIALGSVPGAAAIYLLEIFVAFLQAFIFAFLTSLFMGLALHRH